MYALVRWFETRVATRPCSNLIKLSLNDKQLVVSVGSGVRGDRYCKSLERHIALQSIYSLRIFFISVLPFLFESAPDTAAVTNSGGVFLIAENVKQFQLLNEYPECMSAYRYPMQLTVGDCLGYCHEEPVYYLRACMNSTGEGNLTKS